MAELGTLDQNNETQEDMVDEDIPLFEHAEDEESVGDEHAHRNVEMLDDYLDGTDFQLTFLINQISIEITGNRSTDKYGNKKLMNFGCEEQKYKMTKTGDEISINICGWNIGTHDKFKELFKFVMRSKNTFT